jgi:hypothetical protein
MALLGLDHLVVAVRDPEAAAAELERTVGLACTGGGRHPSWGTYNRLAWLGDTYVELIGVFDRSLAPSGAVSRTVLAAMDAGAQGLVTYALASDDLAGDVERWRGAGASLSDLETRSRTRPDGEVVSWRATFPPSLGPTDPPFVIEHELVGAEWGDEARQARAAEVHPLGGRARVVGLELRVPDVATTSAAYASTLGLTADSSSSTVHVGDQHVRFVTGRPLVEPAVVEIERLDAPAPVRPRDVDCLGVRWRLVI